MQRIRRRSSSNSRYKSTAWYWYCSSWSFDTLIYNIFVIVLLPYFSNYTTLLFAVFLRRYPVGSATTNSLPPPCRRRFFCRSVYETRSPVHWSGDTSSLYSIRTSTILRRVSIRFCCSTTTIVWFVAVQFVILFSYYVILIFNQYLDRLLYHRFLLLIKKLQQKNPRPVKIEDL